jgi:hypothetical protein
MYKNNDNYLPEIGENRRKKVVIPLAPARSVHYVKDGLPDFPKFSSLQMQIKARTLLTSFMNMMVELLRRMMLLLWLSKADVSDSSVTLKPRKCFIL